MINQTNGTLSLESIKVYSNKARATRVLHLLSGHVMQSESEHIVSYKPGLALGLEDETLKEPDRRIIISL